jgi:hypothetical protein
MPGIYESKKGGRLKSYLSGESPKAKKTDLTSSGYVSQPEADPPERRWRAGEPLAQYKECDCLFSTDWMVKIFLNFSKLLLKSIVAYLQESKYEPLNFHTAVFPIFISIIILPGIPQRIFFAHRF